MIKAIKKLLLSPKVDFSAAQRNEPCPCGSGRKYKLCHYNEIRAKQREASHARHFTNPKG